MRHKTCRLELFAFVSAMLLGVNSFSIFSNVLRAKPNVGMGVVVQGCCAVRHLHSRNGDFLMMVSGGTKPPPRKTIDAKFRGGAVRKSSGTTSKEGGGASKAVSPESTGVRLNKCLLELSRRGADDAIAEGRVTINNKPATNGMRVQKRDIVRLDGKMQHWEGTADAKKVAPSAALEDRSFIYLKYWKTRGVTCTSDLNDKTNIIKAGQFDLFPQRVFTVGRLDKDSTGLILLTSDGRVNQALLSPSTKREKVYQVQFDKTPTNAQILSLAEGVVITTIAQRDSRTGSSGSKSATPLTAKTKPCKVFRKGGADSRNVEIVLTEGRNRQIRKMAEALGLAVVNLHRTGFAGISLKGLSEGNWAEFSEKEMQIVQDALAASSASGIAGKKYEEEDED